MTYWLLKSEPNAFSIDDLKKRPDQTEHWDGVRNFQARNILRDQMRVGDLAFFYHSSCEQPGIVGIAEVVRTGYPDHTAFDPQSKYFDPKSDPVNPRWFMVDVRYLRHTRRLIPLAEVRTHQELQNMLLLRRGNRLSITPLPETEWQAILQMEG